MQCSGEGMQPTTTAYLLHHERAHVDEHLNLMLVSEDARHHYVVQNGLGVHTEALGDGDDTIRAECALCT